MFGWCPVDYSSDRQKAAQQLWHRWAGLVGSDYTGPAAHPELAASERSLARQRDVKRESTLRRLVDDGIIEIDGEN